LLLTSVPDAGAQVQRFYDPFREPQRRAPGDRPTGWVVAPDIRLTETYQENPTLAASDARRSDFITEITPGLRIEGGGPRLRASFSYRPSLLLYARHSREDRLVNNLRGFASLEAVENFFFVDVNGSIRQNFISPFGARPEDVTIVTPNRTETRTFGISPHVRGELGAGYVYELRNRNQWTSSDTNALSDVHSTQWTGRFASPVRLFGWEVEYDDRKTRLEQFSAQPDLRARLVRGRVLFQPDYAWRFWVTAGREETNYLSLNETKSTTTRGAGAAWRPTPRTSAAVEYERRFFGPSRLARLQHRTRLTAWHVSYSRAVSDLQQELLRLPPGDSAALLDDIFAARIPDPTERRAAVEEFMRAAGIPEFLAGSLAFYTPQIMLQERLEASAGIIGVRNSITFSVFASESTRLSEGFASTAPDVFLLGNRIEQRGFSIRAAHKLTPFTAAGVSARRVHSQREDPPGLESRNDYVAFTVDHILSPKTTTFGGLSLTTAKVEDVAQTRRETRSAFVGIHHRF
jgi:uncharacterized protein (PEP-CTERM system associated)